MGNIGFIRKKWILKDNEKFQNRKYAYFIPKVKSSMIDICKATRNLELNETDLLWRMDIFISNTQ